MSAPGSNNPLDVFGICFGDASWRLCQGGVKDVCAIRHPAIVRDAFGSAKRNINFSIGLYINCYKFSIGLHISLGVVFSLNWMIGLTTTLWQNRANFAMFASLPVSISECRVVDAVNKNWIVRVSAKFVEHGGNDFICLPTLISETNVCLTFCCKKIWVGSTGISRFGYVFLIGIFVFAMIIRLVYGLKKTVCCWTQQDGIIAQRHDGVFLTNQIWSVWNHMFFSKNIHVILNFVVFLFLQVCVDSMSILQCIVFHICCAFSFSNMCKYFFIFSKTVRIYVYIYIYQ